MWCLYGDLCKVYCDGKFKFDFDGEKLYGVWVLVCMYLYGMGKYLKEQWLLIKECDDQVCVLIDYDVMQVLFVSVIIGEIVGVKFWVKGKVKIGDGRMECFELV